MRPRQHPHPFHRGCLETDPIAEPRSLDFVAKWLAMIEAEADEACRLGPRMARWLAALIGFLGPDGRCFPSTESVAEAAGVCRRTGDEAARRAVALGYLVVINRTETLPNGQVRQTANSYAFRLPLAAVPAKALGLAWRKSWWERLKARRANSVRRVCAETEASVQTFFSPAEARAALERIRIAREEKHRLAWLSRPAAANAQTTRAGSVLGGP